MALKKIGDDYVNVDAIIGIHPAGKNARGDQSLVVLTGHSVTVDGTVDEVQAKIFGKSKNGDKNGE